MSLSMSTRRLCSLTTPELFIVCSVRLLAPVARTGGEIDAHCREGFERARLGAALARQLAAAIGTMQAASARPPDIRALRCAEVGSGEEAILQALLLLQHENEFGARRVLWRILPPAPARVVLAHLDEVALGMVRAGLHLPQLPYPLRPCPAEALAARRLGAAPSPEPAETFWLQ